MYTCIEYVHAYYKIDRSSAHRQPVRWKEPRNLTLRFIASWFMQQIATRICVTTVKRMIRNDDIWVFRILPFCNTAFFSSDLVLGFFSQFRGCSYVSDEKRREKEKEQERLVAYRKPETRCTRERTGVKWPDAHVTTSYNQTRSSNMRNLETFFEIFRIILLLQLVSSHQNFPRGCCWVSMFLFRNRRITVVTSRYLDLFKARFLLSFNLYSDFAMKS